MHTLIMWFTVSWQIIYHFIYVFHANIGDSIFSFWTDLYKFLLQVNNCKFDGSIADILYQYKIRRFLLKTILFVTSML